MHNIIPFFAVVWIFVWTAFYKNRFGLNRVLALELGAATFFALLALNDIVAIYLPDAYVNVLWLKRIFFMIVAVYFAVPIIGLSKKLKLAPESKTAAE